MVVEEIIISLYEYTKSVMSEMNALRPLEVNNLLAIENLCEYVRDHLHFDSDDNDDDYETSFDLEDDQNILYDDENDSHSPSDDSDENGHCIILIQSRTVWIFVMKMIPIRQML